MKVEATTYATIPIACAPGAGRGACFAVNLEARVSAEPATSSGVTSTGPHKSVVDDVAKRTLKMLGKGAGLKLKAECDIPKGAGLGEEVAVSVATALAVIGAVSDKHGSVNELKLDKYLTKQFFMLGDSVVDKRALVDIVAAKSKRYPRVYSSMYGGFSVADEKSGDLLRKGEMEDLHVVLAANAGKPMDRSIFNNEREIILYEALRGNLYTASKLNSLLYARPEAIEAIMKAGALTTAATRTGSIAALTRDASKVKPIEKAMKKLGKLYALKAVNGEARVSVRPRRIYRVNEFLRLKGAKQYNYV